MRISDWSSDVCSSDLALDAADFNEARAQMIVPLALGADTGRHMAATDAVRPLAQAPERPQIELAATLGNGDSFARLLEQIGRAHVCTPVPNAHLVTRLLLEQKHTVTTHN